MGRWSGWAWCVGTAVGAARGNEEGVVALMRGQYYYYSGSGNMSRGAECAGGTGVIAVGSQSICPAVSQGDIIGMDARSRGGRCGGGSGLAMMFFVGSSREFLHEQEVQCPATTDRVAAPVFGAIRDSSGLFQHRRGEIDG